MMDRATSTEKGGADHASQTEEVRQEARGSEQGPEGPEGKMESGTTGLAGQSSSPSRQEHGAPVAVPTRCELRTEEAMRGHTITDRKTAALASPHAERSGSSC